MKVDITFRRKAIKVSCWIGGINGLKGSLNASWSANDGSSQCAGVIIYLTALGSLGCRDTVTPKVMVEIVVVVLADNLGLVAVVIEDVIRDQLKARGNLGIFTQQRVAVVVLYFVEPNGEVAKVVFLDNCVLTILEGGVFDQDVEVTINNNQVARWCIATSISDVQVFNGNFRSDAQNREGW